MNILKKFTDFRAAEKLRLETGTRSDGRPLTIGDVTSVNITMLSAGLQHNVVPNEAEACIDMRVTPTTNLELFEKTLREWVSSEGGSTLEFKQQFKSSQMTPITQDNPWWVKLAQVAEKRNIPLEPEIFPAATDSRYIRKAGYMAFGISPFRHTPVLLHDHNEYLNENVFLEGVDFYFDLLQSFGNL
jgi:aminoacylase